MSIESVETYSPEATRTVEYAIQASNVAGVAELLTTTQAARELGISGRTLARYVERELLTPTLVLPSGHYRWELADIRRQLEALRAQPNED